MVFFETMLSTYNYLVREADKEECRTIAEHFFADPSEKMLKVATAAGLASSANRGE